MSTTTKQKIFVLFAFAMVAVAALVIAQKPASAHAETGRPYHSPNTFGYTLGVGRPTTMHTAFPYDIRGYSANWEAVYWKPVLQRWNGSAFVNIPGAEVAWRGVWANQYR